jgi:hypothetical protein
LLSSQFVKVIDSDLILVWTPEQKRIITGSDLLGRLMRGIVRRNPVILNSAVKEDENGADAQKHEGF